MQTHLSGAIKGERQGAVPVVHSFPLDITGTTAALKVTIAASATKPVRAKFSFITGVAFNGTTPTISVGSTTTANEFLSAVTPAAAGSEFGTPVTKLLTADTSVYAKYTGGGSNTTGAGYVLLTLEELNVSALVN